MTGITRRRSLGMVGGAAATLFAASAADAATSSFVAIGDSYTRSYRNGVPSWADQIHASGAARLLFNFGYSGATAEGQNTAGTLDGQVDRLVAKYSPSALPGRVVIYMGYNDISPERLFRRGLTQYRQAVDRLIAYGATQGTRRIVLCTLHDWSRNPLGSDTARARVLSWNKYLGEIAADRRNVAVANIFSRFEDVFRNKSAYGLVNVTDVNKALSETTYLYLDGNHFGRKGQSIIADVVKPLVI
jgi:lysophospholipase L1-like esterase